MTTTTTSRAMAPHRSTALLGVVLGVIGLTGAALSGALTRRDHARLTPRVLSREAAATDAAGAVLVAQGSTQATQLVTGLVKLTGQRVTLNYAVELVPTQATVAHAVTVWFDCVGAPSDASCKHGTIAFASADPPPPLTAGRVTLAGVYNVSTLDGQDTVGVLLTRAAP